MDPRLQQLIHFTKEKIGLEKYRLHTTDIYLERSLSGAMPILSMEWFPNEVEEPIEDDMNPPGTAVVELDIKSRRFKSIIFVQAKTLADRIRFDKSDQEGIIRWIEQETGLTYDRQFSLKKREGLRSTFQSCYEGIPTSPTGYIEIELDEAGRLVFFSSHGDFPSDKLVLEQQYTLTIDQDIEQIAFQQLKLVRFPSQKEEKWQSVYAIEEIYVAADKQTTIPFELDMNMRNAVKVGQVMRWDAPLTEPFARQSLDLDRKSLTVEQAFSFESNLEQHVITIQERAKIIEAVLQFLRKEFPNDSEKWILKRIYRDENYVLAELKPYPEDAGGYEKKMKVFIDPVTFEAINYINNAWLLEAFKNYKASEKITVSKSEAFEQIKAKLELSPIYVYDFERKRYVLCGKLDCHVGVLASGGGLVSMDEL